MKPRNKMERRVVELAPTLPELTDEQQCQMLKFADPTQDDWKAWDVTLAQQCEEFQVFRIFRVCIKNGGDGSRYYSRCNYGSIHKEVYILGELYQIWLDPTNGNIAINGHSQTGFWMNNRPCYQWQFYYEMSIKQDGTRSYYYGYGDERYITTDWFIADTWHPLILRNCGGNPPEGAEAKRWIKLIMTYPQAETLWKTDKNFFEHIFATSSKAAPELLTAAKICIRNHYKPSDYNLWTDMVKLLKELHLDIHNAHYVCPDNLREAHDRYHRAHAKMVEEQRAEQRRQELIARSKPYADRIAPFLQLAWHTDQYAVFVCPSVADMVEEGQKMHHCVGSMGYDKKPDSLILFCRTPNGDRISTIEYSISRGKVIQNRAACNKVPLYLDEVNKMLEHDADRIRACKLININKNKVQPAATALAVAA